MPSMSIAHTVPLNAPIDVAWGKLQEEATWAGVGPISYVSNSVHTGDGILASFEWGAEVGGKTYRGSARAARAEPPNLIVFDMVTSEIEGKVTTELHPTGDTCEATVTMGLATKGILSTMFFPAIKGALTTGFPEQVEDLKNRI
ncbi:MAG: SRPBCC family protein [Acidimicrobiia bacterium]